MKKTWVPNIITCVRLVGALIILFLPVPSAVFFTVYTLCGLSDVLDGATARVLKAESAFGAKLDSVSDMVFYAVMLIRLMPVLWETLPSWIWLAVAAILMLRLCAYLVAALRYHRFAAMHTYLNKLTGLCVFLIPYFVGFDALTVYCMIVCAIGTLASAEEFIIHAYSPVYNANRKSLFWKKEN